MDSRWEGEFYVVLDNHVDSRWQGGVSYNVVLDNHVGLGGLGDLQVVILQPCRIRTLIGMGGGVPFVMDKHVDSRWSYWQPRRF